MHVALRQLGIPEIYHFTSVSANPSDSKIWLRANAAKHSPSTSPPFARRDWDALLGHCSGVMDTPAAMFAPELIATYPEAKVILLGRDFESWYASADRTIFTIGRDDSLITRLVRRYLDWPESGQIDAMAHTVWDSWLGGDWSKENIRRVFTGYFEDIRKRVPQERLLEFKPDDGFRPLCEFLGVEVPMEEIDSGGRKREIPFPHLNDSASFADRVRCEERLMMRRALKKVGWGLVLVLGIGVAVYGLTIS